MALYASSYLDAWLGPVINTFPDSSGIAPLNGVVEVDDPFELFHLSLRGVVVVSFSFSDPAEAAASASVLVNPMASITSMARIIVCSKR